MTPIFIEHTVKRAINLTITMHLIHESMCFVTVFLLLLFFICCHNLFIYLSFICCKTSLGKFVYAIIFRSKYTHRASVSVCPQRVYPTDVM